MVFWQLSKTLLLFYSISYVNSLRFGFDQVIYSGEEGTNVTITVIKEEVNVGDFTITVSLFTFQDFDSRGLISSAVRPDPAELPDFNSTRFQVTFPASTQNAAINVTISLIDDTVHEADEGFFMVATFSSQNNQQDTENSGTINGGVTLVTIVDNDALSFSFSQGMITIEEPVAATNNVTTVVKSIDSELDLTVFVTAVDDTAQQGVDYQFSIAILELNFSPQDLTMEVPFTILPDQVVEPQERFRLSLSIPSNPPRAYSLGAIDVLNVEIMDNDVAVIGFQMSVYSVNENAGFVTLSVVLIEPSDSSLLDNSTTFRYAVETTGGTAQGNGVDFRDFLSGSVAFGEGADSHMISIIDDSITEITENFTVSGTRQAFSVGAFIFQPSMATVSILDNDGSGGGMGGDPHFSILLPHNQLLCFSVQGEDGFTFNLISNDFLQLNGLFVSDATKNDITWIGAMGLTVKGSKYKQLNDTKIRFMASDETIFLGDKVKLNPKRVKRVRLSHGALSLSEREDEYKGPLQVFVDLEDVGLQFMVKFVKGTHLDVVWNKVMRQPKSSHGIIGQFLRAGVDIDEARGLLFLPNMEPVPVMPKPIWRFMEREVPQEQMCWVSMNPGRQGKKLIEGHYLDYLVDDILSSESISKKFE